jgi:hypothetical protein
VELGINDAAKHKSASAVPVYAWKALNKYVLFSCMHGRHETHMYCSHVCKESTADHCGLACATIKNKNKKILWAP